MLETAEGRKMTNRWHAPPSGRANTNVTRMHLPLAALKWVAVVLGVLSMLVVAPLVDLAGSGLSRLRLLFSGGQSRRR
jgi:hypothetical protein